jgi:meso-butanediol dehydrogenase / (S,S)-butanediol dehydrogenase / diacetyl reductase
MEQKVAIVTGAGTGIGESVSRMLAEQGVRIIAVGRRPEPLAALAAALKDKAEVVTMSADVCAVGTPAAVVALAMEKFGRLDYLVNNAGMGKPFPVHETTDEIFDGYIDVHLKAPFKFCREALAVMKDGASIVNLASTAAVVGIARAGAYSAAKAGVIGFSRHMAAQYGALGIRTNVVAPGVVETPMTEYAWQLPRFRRNNFDQTPLNRTCTADDVANAIVYLLSDQARFITGQVVMVDGGFSSTKILSESAVTAVPTEPAWYDA